MVERGPSNDYWFPPTTFLWARFSAPSEEGGQMNPLVLLEVGSTFSTPMVFELRYRRSSFDAPPNSTIPLSFSLLHEYLRLVFRRESQSFSLSPPPPSAKAGLSPGPLNCPVLPLFPSVPLTQTLTRDPFLFPAFIPSLWIES